MPADPPGEPPAAEVPPAPPTVLPPPEPRPVPSHVSACAPQVHPMPEQTSSAAATSSNVRPSDLRREWPASGQIELERRPPATRGRLVCDRAPITGPALPEAGPAVQAGVECHERLVPRPEALLALLSAVAIAVAGIEARVEIRAVRLRRTRLADRCALIRGALVLHAGLAAAIALVTIPARLIRVGPRRGAGGRARISCCRGCPAAGGRGRKGGAVRPPGASPPGVRGPIGDDEHLAVAPNGGDRCREAHHSAQPLTCAPPMNPLQL